MRTLISLVLAGVSLSAATLVKDGSSAYSICLAADATPAERHAADELSRFIAQMSGASLPVAESCDARHPHIFVGFSPTVARLLPGLTAASFGEEEYLLRSTGRHIVILGGRPRGTLYGAYALLDRLGCRWFTREVSRIPRRPTIEIAALDERRKPAFEYREPYFTEALDKDWAARNRANGTMAGLDASTGGKVEYYPFVHSFYSLVPPEKYFKEHPEYFSLIDGARRVDGGQLCLTNPDVLRVAVAQVRDWIREHPDARIISVSQNDSEGWCECDRCRRVEREEGGQHSGPILRFVNAVAAEIEKTNPDKLIDTLAYWYSENPPAQVRPRPNVRIRLCPIGACVAHPYEQCPRSAYFLKNLKAWAAITHQLYIWHYNTNFAHYLAPLPDFDELAADIPLYQRNGVVGIFLEGAYGPGGGADNAELRSYIMARLLWDTHTDVNRDIDEFLEGVYGSAAKPMRAYFDLFEHEVRLPPAGLGQHLWIFNLPSFSPAFAPQAHRLFDQALQAADDPAVRSRVLKARLPIEYLDLLSAWEYRVDGETFAPRDLASSQTAFREFAAKLDGFGVRSIREGRALAGDEKLVAGMRTYRVTPLENEHWKVAVMPELGGRILRMIDRATGRDLLREARPGEGSYPATGGQLVEAYPDFPIHAWPATWTQLSATPLEAVLTGLCPNGLKLERRIRLDGPWVHTEVTAENGSSTPIEVVLQARADLEPGDIDQARVRWHSASAENVDKLLIVPQEQPTGSETWKGQDVPAGEWTLSRPGLSAVVNRFPQNLAERTTLSWTAKGGPRVTLGVWSQKRTLAPGEHLRLEADYR